MNSAEGGKQVGRVPTFEDLVPCDVCHHTRVAHCCNMKSDGSRGCCYCLCESYLADPSISYPASTPEAAALQPVDPAKLKDFADAREADIALHCGSYRDLQVALQSQIEICNDLRKRLQQAEIKLGPEAAALSDDHQAHKMYPGRASYGLAINGTFQSDGFAVFANGHTIAECEDSEVADWICAQWNKTIPAPPSGEQAENGRLPDFKDEQLRKMNETIAAKYGLDLDKLPPIPEVAALGPQEPREGGGESNGPQD